MIFGYNNKYFISVLGIFITIIATLETFFMKDINLLNILLIIATIVFSIFKILNETNELRLKSNKYFEIKEDYIEQKISLSEEYIDNNYVIKCIEQKDRKEKFVISDRINSMLYTNSLEIKDEGTFVLSEEIKDMVPFSLEREFKKDKVIYNSNLIRLSDDIFLSEEKPIRVQKATYFQSISTNGIIDLVIKDMTILGNQRFDGKKLLFSDNGNELISLSESYCANILGGSTLAITKDNYLILQIQAKKSHINKNNLSPSGSGSTDYQDLKIINKRGNKKIYFQDLAIITMERELCEECNIEKYKKHLYSKVIGYSRLLERGGKPDFFGITYIDINSSEIRESFKEKLEIGNYEIIKEKLDSKNLDDSIINKLEEYILDTRFEGNISIQIYIFLYILKDYKKNGEKIFKNLIESK